MAYRDENQALRARLEATEQRLRVVENELADARRRLEEEPAPLAPSVPPRASRRVGYPPPKPTQPNQYAAVSAAVSGIVLLLAGSAFLLWNLPADEGGLEILETMFVGVVMALVPGLLLLRYALRSPPISVPAAEPVVVRPRVVLPRRIEVVSGRDDVDLHGDVFGVELRAQHVAERRS